MAASSRKRRPPGLTDVLGDVVDDTKELVDDALDRAGQLERDARRGTGRAVDGARRPRSGAQRPKPPTSDEQADEIDSLRAALDDLTAKVNRLAQLRAENGSTSR